MSLSSFGGRLALALAGCLFSASLVYAADTLAQAKELYAAAAYDDALAVLDRLASREESASEATAIAEHRVFCLLALDRKAEALKGIETLVRQDPFYRPSDQISPRILTVLRDGRRQALPKVAMERYALARSAFERKDPQARLQFERLVALLGDPELSESPALGDLKTVASAFLDLTIAMASVPPPAPVPTAASQSATPPPVTLPEPRVPAVNRVYTSSDPDVVPPTALSQALPAWRSPVGERREFSGTLELLLDEKGAVLSAVLRAPVHPLYDKVLLKAAANWRFTPATRQGMPVRFLRFVEIKLKPN